MIYLGMYTPSAGRGVNEYISHNLSLSINIIYFIFRHARIELTISDAQYQRLAI